MRLPDSAYEYIKGEVANIYVQHNIRKYPICAMKLATQMGFIVVPYSSLEASAYSEAVKTSIDGFYAERSWNEYIFVNDTMAISKERKSITIFHEIGHPVLGHDGSVLDDETKEAEASFFSKYLAAPPPAIHLINPKSKQDIQIAFGLSCEASRIAMDYYDKWKNKVNKAGLAEYDMKILNQLGIGNIDQLEQYTNSIKEGSSYEHRFRLNECFVDYYQ